MTSLLKKASRLSFCREVVVLWVKGLPEAVPVQNGSPGRHEAGRWVLLLVLFTLCGYMVASSRLGKPVQNGGPWAQDKAGKVTSLLKKGVKAVIL